MNGFMYYYELFFMDKVKLTIYAQDAYCHLLWMIANGKVTLKYKEKLSWLEDYNNDTPSRQLALALYAEKLQKFSMSESTRNDAVLKSVKIRAKESIEKTEKGSERLLKLLTTCEYHVGTLQDAIPKEKVIFFNYGKDKTQKRTFKLIAENSDLEMDFAFTAEVVFLPLCTTFIPVSRFCPSPANVMPVYSIFAPSPCSMVMG